MGVFVFSLKYKVLNEVVGVYWFFFDLEWSVFFIMDPKCCGVLVCCLDFSLRTVLWIYDVIGQVVEELLMRKCGSCSIFVIVDGDDCGSERNLVDLIGELGLVCIFVFIIEFNENFVLMIFSGLVGRIGGWYIYVSKGRDLM